VDCSGLQHRLSTPEGSEVRNQGLQAYVCPKVPLPMGSAFWTRPGSPGNGLGASTAKRHVGHSPAPRTNLGPQEWVGFVSWAAILPGMHHRGVAQVCRAAKMKELLFVVPRRLLLGL
jgi:hypothetical protein